MLLLTSLVVYRYRVLGQGPSGAVVLDVEFEAAGEAAPLNRRASVILSRLPTIPRSIHVCYPAPNIEPSLWCRLKLITLPASEMTWDIGRGTYNVRSRSGQTMLTARGRPSSIGSIFAVSESSNVCGIVLHARDNVHVDPPLPWKAVASRICEQYHSPCLYRYSVTTPPLVLLHGFFRSVTSRAGLTAGGDKAVTGHPSAAAWPNGPDVCHPRGLFQSILRPH